MQAVADLVDGALLGSGQRAGGREGVFVEEETHFVAAGEEVGVADVCGGGGGGGGVAGGEFG